MALFTGTAARCKARPIAQKLWGKARRLTGLRALYYRYLYELGALPHKPRRPSYAVRQDIRNLDRRIRQMEFLSANSIDSIEQLQAKQIALENKIAELQTERQRLYRTAPNSPEIPAITGWPSSRCAVTLSCARRLPPIPLKCVSALRMQNANASRNRKQNRSKTKRKQIKKHVKDYKKWSDDMFNSNRDRYHAEYARRHYPVGTKIRLLAMNDPYDPVPARHHWYRHLRG